MTWLAAFWRCLRRRTTRERIAPSGVALSLLAMFHEHPIAVAAGAFGLVIFIAAWAGTDAPKPEQPDLRDIFAAAALAGIIAEKNIGTRQSRVHAAYEYADLMVRHRQEG